MRQWGRTTLDSNLQDFLNAVTHTVVSFVPDGGLYENANTGEKFESGTVTFDCGHTYTWRPWGAKTREDIPTVGRPEPCALCMDIELSDRSR